MSLARQISPRLVRSLEVLVAVAETGQMRSGAQLLGLSQPAASQHIAALELAFGMQLLDRSSRPARLTHAGVRLHLRAQKILLALADLQTEMRHVGQTSISLLRVGIQASIATTITPSLVSLAQDTFGVQDITLYAGQSGDHEQLLRTKQADLAISSSPFLDMDGLERHPILTEDYLLVLPVDYNGPIHSLDAVQDRLPLVRFGDTTNAGRQIAQHLRRLRFEPRKVIQADRSSMVTSCVAKGQGFSLLTPTLLIDGMVENMPLQIKPLPVAGLSRTLTAVSRLGELRTLPAMAATLAATELRQQIARFIGQVGLDALSET